MGGSLIYEFSCDWQGCAMLETGVARMPNDSVWLPPGWRTVEVSAGWREKEVPTRSAVLCPKHADELDRLFPFSMTAIEEDDP